MKKVAVFFGGEIFEQGTGDSLTSEEKHELCIRSNMHDKLVDKLKGLVEILDTDGGTALDWLIDNDHELRNLLKEAKGEL